MSSFPAFRVPMPDRFMNPPNDILAVLRIAFEGAPNAVFVAEEDGSIVFANAVAASTFHYKAEELIGQQVSRLIYPLAAAVSDGSNLESLPPVELLEALTGHTVDGLRSDGVIVPLELGVKTAANGGRRLL